MINDMSSVGAYIFGAPHVGNLTDDTRPCRVITTIEP